MTVAELQEKLMGLDPKTHIVINRESDAEAKLFEITNVAICTGEAFRDEKTHQARSGQFMTARLGGSSLTLRKRNK